jgi:hypothetical protein
MFKLIKILNSGSNVPEPVYLPSSGISAKAGTAMTLSGGALAHCPATTAPSYVLLRDLKATDTKALCFRISSDMLFETPIMGAPNALSAGSKVKLYVNSASAAVGVSADTASGVAKIVSLDGATSQGQTVTVNF